MFKQRMFRKQQLTFMLLNLIAFTIIFTIFGVIVFTQVQNTLFSKTDDELLELKRLLVENPAWNGDFHGPNDLMKPKELVEQPDNTIGNNSTIVDNPPVVDDSFTPPGERRRNPNPRILILNWDKEGNIVNQDQIGSQYYDYFFQNYQLNTSILDSIEQITINDTYPFRYILFEDMNKDDHIAYTQLMINVDAEQTIVTNFERLIFICSVIFILLSILSSYLLSKRMMTPILHSWNKQAEFVENASHELRTPLTIIQNKLELMLTTPQETIANRFEHVALSLSEVRRLSKLTSDLLTLARADSAETELQTQPIEVDEFLTKVCTPYIEIAESMDKHMWVKLDSRATMVADDVRLHQLVVILLDNALKYTSEHDSIGVKSYLEDQKVVIEVNDTGIGIKEENLPYVFDRFYREDKARSRETGGVGLGLSIAQWIVAKHNGTIKVTSDEQKGTTFKIKLPK